MLDYLLIFGAFGAKGWEAAFYKGLRGVRVKLFLEHFWSIWSKRAGKPHSIRVSWFSVLEHVLEQRLEH